jgi:hypothetical protein
VVGPWGGTGGYPWDDGVYSTIRQIVITHGAAIDSIRIEYDLKGRSVWSETHGGTDGGSDTDKVLLTESSLKHLQFFKHDCKIPLKGFLCDC